MSFFECIFGLSTYKPRQGMLIRRICQLVCAICGLGLVLNVVALLPYGGFFGLSTVFVFMLLVAVLWLSWRITQHPAVGDFLIDVQVESRRVSWSRVDDVKRSTLIVLSVMFSLSLYLFLCDLVLQFILRSALVLKF